MRPLNSHLSRLCAEVRGGKNESLVRRAARAVADCARRVGSVVPPAPQFRQIPCWRKRPGSPSNPFARLLRLNQALAVSHEEQAVEFRQVLWRQAALRFPALSFSSRRAETVRPRSNTICRHRPCCRWLQNNVPARTPPWHPVFSRTNWRVAPLDLCPCARAVSAP